MKMFDFLCVGEATIDVFVQFPKTGDYFTIEKDRNDVKLLLGQKIPVESSSLSVGGNAAHVAIGLARLGFRASLAAEVGTDEFSEKIVRELDKEKVDKSLFKQVARPESTFNVCLTVGEDRIILVHHIIKEQNFSFENIQAQWVFVTSMGDMWEDAYKKTAEFVKKTQAKLAFNPGGAQRRKGVESYKEIIALCDVLFVNKEEAEEMLYGEVLSQEKQEPIESLLFRLNRMGPKIVVITDGENGSFAIDEKGVVSSQKAFKEKVTEKTGAGDAFSTGFLAALASGKDVPTALLWGTADAAGVVSKYGGQEGLLTKEELLNKIKEKS